MIMTKTYISKIGTVCCTVVAALMLTSCNDFLDKLPDDRAELNNEKKITQLLVSAYPAVTSNMPFELLSDNVDDSGRGYSSPIICEDYYRMKDTNEEGMDTPYHIWDGYYEAVATVNQALEAIDELGNPESLRGTKAEGKLIRAFCMMQLANTFCMPWNPDKADEYQGLPYPTTPEKNVNTTYERGTLRELYAAIDKDIQEALPDIALAEQNYKTPKYHFNVKAAYAFACRFYLYYMQYDKAIECANQVLGNDPTTVMRNYEPYRDLGRDDFSNLWIRSSEDANLMIINAGSLSSRYLPQGTGNRFNHNYDIVAYETFWVDGPWGEGSNKNSIIYANKLYGTNQAVAFPSYEEQFEYTDKVAHIGHVHVVDPVFTGDLTVLERAEAYALSGNLDKAIADMNTWMSTHCKDKVEDGEVVAPAPAPLTQASINGFITKLDYAKRTPDGNRDRSMRKRMHPQGFSIKDANTENVLQLLLHMKRLESVFHGLRFVDVKRYGIEYTHEVVGEDPVVFIAGDLRGAIQIPQTVITAGIPGNPRMTKEEIDAYIESTKAEYEDSDDDE